MKRFFLVATAVVAACALTPSARAASLLSTNLLNTGSGTAGATAGASSDKASVLNPILNTIPFLSGPDQRHICLISDQVDKSWCFYVAIP